VERLRGASQQICQKRLAGEKSQVMTYSPGCACVPPDAHSLVDRVDTTESRGTSSRIDGRAPAQSRTRRPPQGDSDLCLSVVVRDKKTHDTRHTHTPTHNSCTSTLSTNPRSSVSFSARVYQTTSVISRSVPQRTRTRTYPLRTRLPPAHNAAAANSFAFKMHAEQNRVSTTKN
jgi:hypothetical protein